uniref:G domain-containing protein n=1 Tax=Glossina austeni TaxID=7395 RepID=A0A1A9UGY7_GLOAU
MAEDAFRPFGLHGVAHKDIATAQRTPQHIKYKTGYGIEELITQLQKIWAYTGDVYLMGCTKVGKSSLFNVLLNSDYSRPGNADIIPKATTCPWPGTTLQMLKVPIYRPSDIKVYDREKRTHDEELYNKYINTPLLQLPFGEASKLSRCPGLSPSRQRLTAKGYVVKPKCKELTCSSDITLSTAGWISLRIPVDVECKFQAWTPQGNGFYVRDSFSYTTCLPINRQKNQKFISI